MQENIDIRIREDGARVVKRSIEDIGKSADKTSDALGGLKKILGAVVTSAGLAVLVQTLDTFTTLQNRLKVTGAEGENLTGVFQSLLKVANDTRSSLDGSVEIFSRLSASAKELGQNQAQLIQFTKSLNQAIILSGASAMEAEAGLRQLSQGMASGTLKGDELRAILEQLPTVADIIAKSMGVTRGALRELGADGKITAQTILTAFEGARGELEEKFAKTVPTISQSFQVLKNNFINAIGEFDKATGVSALFSKALLFIAENLETILKLALGMGAGWVVVAGGAAAFYAVRDAVIALNIAIAANPIGFMLTLLTSAIALLVLFRDQIKLGNNDITTLGDFFRAFGLIMRQVFDDILAWSKKTFGPLIQQLQDWFGEVDFTLVGIMRMVAKNADFIVNAFKIAINNIIILFTGLGPAIQDIVTSGLNGVLKKISSFVNATGEILSDITGFAGLEKIISADLQLSNENQGAAKKLGLDLANNIVTGLQGTAIQDALESTISLADDIARARKAAEKPGVVNSDPMQAMVSPIKDDGKAKKALDELADSLKRLRESINPVEAAMNQLTEAQALFNKGVQAGLITQAAANDYMARLKESLKEALDPYGAMNDEIKREQELLQMSNKEAQIAADLYDRINTLKAQGVAVTKEMEAALRSELVVTQELSKIAAARDQFEMQSSTAKLEQFKIDLEGFKQALADSANPEGDLAGGLSALLPWANLEGSREQMAAYVQAHADMYAQIKMLVDQSVIDHKTAEGLKAQADHIYNQQRLSQQSQFFGTLAGLSSSSNKKLAAIGKAAAITQAVMNGVSAVQGALATPPYWPLNAGNVIAVGALAAANVASIASQSLGGYRTGGEFMVGGGGVSDSQTVAFRATPGERVTVTPPGQTPETANGSQPAPVVNLRNVNIFDPAIVGEFLATSEGEDVMVNLLSRNGYNKRESQL